MARAQAERAAKEVAENANADEIRSRRDIRFIVPRWIEWDFPFDFVIQTLIASLHEMESLHIFSTAQAHSYGINALVLRVAHCVPLCFACMISPERNPPLPRAQFTLLLAFTLTLASPVASPQSAPASANLPAFDAATIKPPDPRGRDRNIGFYGDPGGRVFYGGYIKLLLEYAFNVQDYQVAGGPPWISSQWFEINAVPPENSLSRNIKVANADPIPEQRLMLQSLLRERFGFKSHLETKEGQVYILTRGKSRLQLKPPKDPAADPRAIVVIKSSGIDGEAVGTNTTIDYLAQRIGRYLKAPVVNQTGLTGSYDFYLPPDDPANQDPVAATLGAVKRLGLKIKCGQGPIQTLVIDQVEQPSEN